MRRTLLCLSLAAIGGCSRLPKYNVYVTGYTAGPPSSIAPGSRIAVLEDPRAGNPLLEHEVANKVQRALAARGFQPVSPADADVAVTVRYGASTVLEQGDELRFEPGRQSTIRDSTGKVIGTVSGDPSFTREATTSTRDLMWLTMTARDRRSSRDSTPARPLWIGESKASGANLPLRAMIDFLLVPAAAAFGLDQPQARTVLRADDASVAAIRVR